MFIYSGCDRSHFACKAPFSPRLCGPALKCANQYGMLGMFTINTATETNSPDRCAPHSGQAHPSIHSYRSRSSCFLTNIQYPYPWLLSLSLIADLMYGMEPTKPTYPCYGTVVYCQLSRVKDKIKSLALGQQGLKYRREVQEHAYTSQQDD